MANPNSGNNSASVALSIPPTDPNTTNKPTINLIILISLSSQHVCSKVFPFFVAGTNLSNSNKSTEANLFGFLTNTRIRDNASLLILASYSGKNSSLLAMYSIRSIFWSCVIERSIIIERLRMAWSIRSWSMLEMKITRPSKEKLRGRSSSFMSAFQEMMRLP
jgi:hypothetical protein